MSQTASTEVEETAGPEPERRRRPRAVVVLAALLCVACLCLAAAVVGFVRERGKVDEQHRLTELRTDALSTAKRYALDFSTYDHTTLDATFEKVASELTGTFKAQYLSTSASLKKTLQKYKGEAVATVQAAGVTSVTSTKAIVVVLLDQSVSSTASPKARVDRSRMVITLERVEGQWLMANLDLK